MNKSEFTQKLINCYKAFGQGFPDKQSDIDFLVNILMEKINPGGIQKFTDGEITFILVNGPYGRFGEVKYLSAVNIWSWFIEFQLTGEREVRNDLLPESCERSEEEKEKDKYDLICLAFEFHKNKREFKGLSRVYDIFDEYGKISLTNERKNEFLEEAKKNIVTNYINTGSKQSKIIDFKKSVADGSNSIQIAEAKRLAIIDFFNGMVLVGTEIKDLFDE